MQMPNVPKRVKDHRKIPLWVYVLFAVALCSLLIYVIAAISPDFADGFNGSVGRAVRAVLAKRSRMPFTKRPAFVDEKNLARSTDSLMTIAVGMSL